MKKRPPVTKIQGPFPSAEYVPSECTSQQVPAESNADLNPANRHRDAGDVSRDRPRVKPPVVPRVFIRGLAGGILEMDLPGLNLEVSASAFAQWISDDSLKGINVRCGDIALIDPVKPLQRGAVVLIGLNGDDVFRRLKKERRIWLLETLDGTNAPSVPLVNYPLYGAVVGFVRLPANAKTVGASNEPADRRFQRTTHRSKSCGRSGKTGDLRPQGEIQYPKRKRSLLLLAAEQNQSPYRLSEPGTACRYSARAKTR